MIKGFYAAVSAMVVNANRQEILAHNAANLDTPGFKQVLSTVEEFWKTGVFVPQKNISPGMNLDYIGSLGLGAENAPDFTDFSQGALELTGNMFDFAIKNEGFFVVETTNGTRYTRDGRFLRDSEGQLVTIDGNFVLDDNGDRIVLPEGEIVVDQYGNLNAGEDTIAKLGLALFANPSQSLEQDEGNLFLSNNDPDGEGTVEVQQRFLEMSNVNPTQLMTQLVEVARSYEAAQKMVQNQDELLGKAISTLGRIG